MKIAHWTMCNGSGMNNVAETLVKAEKSIGLDSHLCNIDEKAAAEWDEVLDADVHVSHTHFPEPFKKRLTKPYKLVWVGHGTPEIAFNMAVESGKHMPHGCSDSWMLLQHWLKISDAVVTFWPRHEAIYRTMVAKKTPVHCIPMGIDKSFWKPVPSNGHFAGSPAVYTAENCHTIKWPFDLFIAWPLVYPKVNGNPSLHALYLPTDMHRWFFPLVNANGAAYGSHIAPVTFLPDGMRNAFCSVDYYIGLVRYGDFNRCSLEANACGCKTISYEGNPYSDFWVSEGDQRRIADQLISILNGAVPARDKSPVPEAVEMAQAMKNVYETC
jgi:hypothetical protein